MAIEKTIFAGFLNLEDSEKLNEFNRKFFRLDSKKNLLEYYSVHKDSKSIPEGVFNINFLSIAGDASSFKPKISNCFYIIVSGIRYFLSADTEKEKHNWIKKLLDATKINFKIEDPQKNLIDNNTPNIGFKVEVVGGVVFKTHIDYTHGIHWVSENNITTSNDHFSRMQDFLITGYCTKLGAIRKNWKYRFFKLTRSRLSYFKTSKDIEPLRSILIKDILYVRPSIGVHPNRKNLFEVVTAMRVFYIQPGTKALMEEWINKLKICLYDINGPDNLEACIQTDSELNISEIKQINEEQVMDLLAPIKRILIKEQKQYLINRLEKQGDYVENLNTRWSVL